MTVLNIAMMQHKPLSAEEAINLWHALPAGEQQRRELKKQLKGWETSRDGTRLFSSPAPISLARDSFGRIVLSQNEPLALDWTGLLCDPEAERMTYFSLPVPQPPSSSKVHDEILMKPSIDWLPLKSNVYPRHNWETGDKSGKRLKVLDLGYQDINGIRAHGHRWWYSRDGTFVDGDFEELWISEDLQINVVYIKESQTEGKGTRAELNHLREKEPDSALFQIAEGVPAHIVRGPLPPNPCTTAPN